MIYPRTSAKNDFGKPESKVLVTGGAGFFGTHICEQLLLNGNHVVVVDMINSETSTTYEKTENIEYLKKIATNNKKSKFKLYKLNILEEKLLCEILQRESPTICIHAAALVMDRQSVMEPIRYIINNVQGTQSLLNAINQSKTINRLVYISSRSAVGETKSADEKIAEDALLRPINPYGATKVAAEALCHAFYKNAGIDVSICRMQPLYGPRCRRDMMPRLLMESALNNKIVEKYGNGEAVRDWLYVVDAAIGVMKVLEDSEEFSIYNLGTGVATTLNELIGLVSEITGSNLNIVQKMIPTGDAVFAGICDYDKAKKKLNWEPKIELKKGLKLMYEFMKTPSM